MNDASTSVSASESRRTLRIVTLALAVAVLPWMAWRSVLSLELLGWDSFPLIASSDLSDPVRTLTQELMGGRYPLGHYWRPLVQLSFGLDRALWELDPLGYHVTDLAVLSTAAVATLALALRLLRSEGAALVAGVLFAVHPVHFEILQAPARRADALCAAFTVLALALAAAQNARRWPALLAALGALAAKETGAIAAPAIFALVACTSARANWRERASEAWQRSWPALAATAAWFALRALVLGGLGGGADFELSNALVRAPGVLAASGASLFGLRDTLSSPAVAAAVSVAALLAFAVLAYALRKPSRANEAPPLGIPLFLAAWFLGLAAVTATSGVDRAWYELPFLPIHALAAAYLVARARAAWRVGLRAAPTCAFAFAALIAGADLARSPLVSARPDIARASDRLRAFLQRFEREVGAAAPGSIVRLDGFPMIEASRIEASGIESSGQNAAQRREVTVLAPYSLVAYAELALPGKRIRCEAAGSQFARPAADEVVVVLSR